VVCARFRCYLVGFRCSLFFVFLGCVFWCFVCFPLFSLVPLLCSPFFGKLCFSAQVSAGSFLRAFEALLLLPFPSLFLLPLFFAFLVGGFLFPLFCSSGTKPYFVYLWFVFYGLVFLLLAFFFSFPAFVLSLFSCFFLPLLWFPHESFLCVGLFCGSFCFTFGFSVLVLLVPFSGGVRCLGSVSRLFISLFLLLLSHFLPRLFFGVSQGCFSL